ncbi:DUF5105 domain-containing protein [Clostridium sp. C2-6-12]|uniref:DUF5105 domain-containing protein n=1 Tax=Clostridium sp. C2-6-12 TaxID=2698832 RepID=UPI00136E4A6A|nr:DUF5105 domain-containing protein [Clostridium sp. C2-6-12]
MKHLKKFFVVILITIITATTAVGCGEASTPPDESAKIFLNILLKNDKTNMDKIGLKEDEYGELRKEFEDYMTQGFSSSGIDENVLTEEVKTNFQNNIINGLTKVDYKVALVSKDKNNAKVEVKIKGFDLQKISTDAQTILHEKVLENPSMTQSEKYKELFNLIGKGIAEGVLAEDEETIEMVLTNENNTWVPDKNDSISIVTAIMQMRES